MGSPVYVSVVLQAARMLEQLAALVARIPTRTPAAQSLLHTVREVLQRGWLKQIGDKSIRSSDEIMRWFSPPVHWRRPAGGCPRLSADGSVSHRALQTSNH